MNVFEIIGIIVTSSVVSTITAMITSYLLNKTHLIA